MIDTMVLQYQFQRKEEYKAFYTRTERFLKQRKLGGLCIVKGAENHYETDKLRKDGFLKIRFFRTEGYYRNFMEIELQPIRLLKQNEHVDLSEFEQYGTIAKKFNVHIAQLLGFGAALPERLEFGNWNVRRIDYAFQLRTPYVEAYVKLLHRGRVPKPFKKILYDTSLYLYSKSKRFNFYDKHSQLMTKKGLSIAERQRSLEILRFEVQCEKKSIEKMKIRFGLEDMSVQSLWDKRIARHVLFRAVTSVLGEQDFYRLDAACSKLLRDSQNVEGASVMRMIAQAETIVGINERFSQKYPKFKKPDSKCKKILKSIQDSGINPIALPEDCGLPDHILCLQNPCHHEFFNESKDDLEQQIHGLGIESFVKAQKKRELCESPLFVD